MTFTDLEYVLMLAVVVMLWRVAVAQRATVIAIAREKQSARALFDLAHGAAKIVKTEDGFAVELNYPKEKTKCA
jgi:hypothetical protein